MSERFEPYNWRWGNGVSVRAILILSGLVSISLVSHGLCWTVFRQVKAHAAQLFTMGLYYRLMLSLIAIRITLRVLGLNSRLGYGGSWHWRSASSIHLLCTRVWQLMVMDGDHARRKYVEFAITYRSCGVAPFLRTLLVMCLWMLRIRHGTLRYLWGR